MLGAFYREARYLKSLVLNKEIVPACLTVFGMEFQNMHPEKERLLLNMSLVGRGISKFFLEVEYGCCLLVNIWHRY